MLKLVFLFLLALDCAGNVLIGGSFHQTLSATSWTVRKHPWFWWIHHAIDIGAFVVAGQLRHTEKAWNNELAGSVWKRVFNKQ